MSAGGKRYIYRPIPVLNPADPGKITLDDLVEIYEFESGEAQKVPLSVFFADLNASIAELNESIGINADAISINAAAIAANASLLSEHAALLSTYGDKLTYYVGHHPTLSALQLANPTPQDGHYGSIGETDSFVMYDVTTSTWKQISGTSGPSGDSISFEADSNADNVFTVLMVGPINTITVDLPTQLTSYSYQVKLNSSSIYVSQADNTALQSWINANVVSASTKWQLRIAVYGSTDYGISAFNFNYLR